MIFMLFLITTPSLLPVFHIHNNRIKEYTLTRTKTKTINQRQIGGGPESPSLNLMNGCDLILTGKPQDLDYTKIAIFFHCLVLGRNSLGSICTMQMGRCVVLPTFLPFFFET